jgi:hypothetical protein
MPTFSFLFIFVIFRCPYQIFTLELSRRKEHLFFLPGTAFWRFPVSLYRLDASVIARLKPIVFLF